MTPNHQFFHQYLQIYRLFTKKLNEQLLQYGLFHSQWSIVYFLKTKGPTTLVEIGEYLNVEKPTITRTVQRLSEGGFIEQVPGKDRREKRIQLTEAGEEVYIACREATNEFECKIMDGISEQEKEAVYQTLTKLCVNLEK
ncbi:MarR family winged helix-turn-helix transcriptional regulator [Peribacillus huizhouensis]|uniref:DNA-binding MarR family transcriptional regulator n=1 Tax=Peribacillus huizhouensis TaxID=1501239 RepID=A0ABR6CSD7_9BACI|nr:MarR family transcriptional regulator [Peribacillus huizhouensis]MBA9027947.1 DNA-binding MarR family transcriptional regulator [Peribacillus huizhouensis]